MQANTREKARTFLAEIGLLQPVFSNDPALEDLLKQEVSDYAAFDLLKTRADDLLSTFAAIVLVTGVVVALLTVTIIPPGTGTLLHDVAARAAAFAAFAILVLGSFAVMTAETAPLERLGLPKRLQQVLIVGLAAIVLLSQGLLWLRLWAPSSRWFVEGLLRGCVGWSITVFWAALLIWGFAHLDPKLSEKLSAYKDLTRPFGGKEEKG